MYNWAFLTEGVKQLKKVHSLYFDKDSFRDTLRVVECEMLMNNLGNMTQNIGICNDFWVH